MSVVAACQKCGRQVRIELENDLMKKHKDNMNIWEHVATDRCVCNPCTRCTNGGTKCAYCKNYAFFSDKPYWWDKKSVSIKEEDLRIEVGRKKPIDGETVYPDLSYVRIEHIPTSMIVTKIDKAQIQAKRKCIEELERLLVEWGWSDESFSVQ